jgi:hypothetical protein
MISHTPPDLSSLIFCGGFLGALIGATSSLRSKADRGRYLGASVFSTAAAGMTVGLLIGAAVRVIPPL